MATSFTLSNGSNSIGIIQGQSVGIKWNITGAYTSVSISNYGSVSATKDNSVTYNLVSICRYRRDTDPKDHYCRKCSSGAPSGYVLEGQLCSFFDKKAPGTFGGVDDEDNDNSNAGKPYSGILGYVYPTSYSAPVSTKLIYEYYDDGTWGTIWTSSSSGEGQYTNKGLTFKTPTQPYTDVNKEYVGSATVTPSSTTTYTLTATGTGGTSTFTQSVIVTVYVPPVVTLSLNKSSIIAGQCTTLSWNTTGDANKIEWLSNNINNFNLTSSSSVCPSDTATYTARVSGPGGVDTDFVTLTVHQIPTISTTIPESLDYGVNGSFEYVSQYCNISLNVKIYYRYATGNPILKRDTDLTKASSSQLSAPDNQTKVSGTIDLDMEYDDFGPRYVDVIMTASGSGGSVTISREIVINIDETPDNIIVPEKEDAIKSQDPVFAPETEIISELLLIDDIDIPVEIKANAPIQVDINSQQSWQNLRQI